MGLRGRVSRAAVVGRDWLRSKGVDITRSQAYRLQQLASKRSVDLVVDVGAHRGEFARMMRAGGYKGEIASFEPVEANYAVLRDMCGDDPAWDCYRIALGSVAGREAISVSKSTDFSSFRSPSAYGRDNFAGLIDVAATEQVQVARLEDVLTGTANGKRRILLKLDTQSWDLEVLRGCGAVLDMVEVVQIELPFLNIYESSPSWREEISFLEGAGFAVVDLYPVTVEPDGALVEADCILVRARRQ